MTFQVAGVTYNLDLPCVVLPYDFDGELVDNPDDVFYYDVEWDDEEGVIAWADELNLGELDNLNTKAFGF